MRGQQAGSLSARLRGSERLLIALVAAAAAAIALLVAPSAPPVFAAGPPVCTSTGGATTTSTINGIRYNTVTFTESGTFTPSHALNADYVVVGGDGGGGGGSGRGKSGTVDIPAAAQAITVGGTSSIADLVAAEGGRGGSGGAGSSGVVIIRFPRFCRNPSPPTSAALSSPTLSWGAPLFMPSGMTLSSYTVTYQLSTSATDMGQIYAKGSTSTSINITGKTVSDCTANNPGWTCDMNPAGDLVSGLIYQFRVFAESSSGALGQMTAKFDYLVP